MSLSEWSEEGDQNVEKQNETLHKPAGANEAKAILKTWLRGRAAGAGSRPESCGNVRKMLTAVQ